MTTVTRPVHTTSAPRTYEDGLQSKSPIYFDRPGEGQTLHKSSINQTFPKSTPIYKKNMQTYHNVFPNWYTHDTDNSATYSGQSTSYMPTPPSTLSPSINSSTTVDPDETKTQITDPVVTPNFSSSKMRSRSLSIPVSTSTCPKCGLRRPSSPSNQSTIPSLPNPPTQSSSPPRTHLPSHLHCPDSCPDDVHPTKELTSPVTSPFRRHHRRRSSLYYAESLVDNADTIDNGGVPVEVRSTWENRAESIARKVVLKALGNDISKVPEDAIVEE